MVLTPTEELFNIFESPPLDIDIIKLDLRHAWETIKILRWLYLPRINILKMP